LELAEEAVEGEMLGFGEGSQAAAIRQQWSDEVEGREKGASRNAKLIGLKGEWERRGEEGKRGAGNYSC
jgi:hypothetical protein